MYKKIKGNLYYLEMIKKSIISIVILFKPFFFHSYYIEMYVDNSKSRRYRYEYICRVLHFIKNKKNSTLYHDNDT